MKLFECVQVDFKLEAIFQQMSESFNDQVLIWIFWIIIVRPCLSSTSPKHFHQMNFSIQVAPGEEVEPEEEEEEEEGKSSVRSGRLQPDHGSVSVILRGKRALGD